MTKLPNIRCLEVGDEVFDHYDDSIYLAIGPQELVIYEPGRDGSGTFSVHNLAELNRNRTLEVLPEGYVSLHLLLTVWGASLEDMDFLTAHFLHPEEHRDLEKRHKNETPARSAREEAAIFWQHRMYRAPGVTLDDEEMF